MSRTRTVEQIAAAVTHFAPAAAPSILRMLDIDLGVMTADAAKDFGAEDARVDAALAEHAKVAADRAGADELSRRVPRRATPIPDTDPSPETSKR